MLGRPKPAILWDSHFRSPAAEGTEATERPPEVLSDLSLARELQLSAAEASKERAAESWEHVTLLFWPLALHGLWLSVAIRGSGGIAAQC